MLLIQQIITSGTIIREGMCGNILSRRVVAFVTEIVACIEFESPFVSLTLTAKSWRRPGISRFVSITLAWHTLLYNVHGRLSILTTGVMVAKQIKDFFNEGVYFCFVRVVFLIITSYFKNKWEICILVSGAKSKNDRIYFSIRWN